MGWEKQSPLLCFFLSLFSPQYAMPLSPGRENKTNHYAVGRLLLLRRRSNRRSNLRRRLLPIISLLILLFFFFLFFLTSIPDVRPHIRRKVEESIQVRVESTTVSLDRDLWKTSSSGNYYGCSNSSKGFQSIMGPVKKLFVAVKAMGGKGSTGGKRSNNLEDIVTSSESSFEQEVSGSRSTTGGKSIKKLKEWREGEEAESLKKNVVAQQQTGFHAGEDDDEFEVSGEIGDDGGRGDDDNDEQFADDMFDDEDVNEEDRCYMEERKKKGKGQVGESSSQAFRKVGRRGRGVATPMELMVTDGTCPGGPVDPSLIPCFSGHILYAVSHDPAKDRGILSHYSQTKKMRKVLVDGWALEGEVKQLVESSGLGHLRGCMFEEYDMPLISAFVDRWQPDTNTFHMPWGEMTILLHDVKQILGLSIDGEQIYATPNHRNPELTLDIISVVRKT